MPVRGLHARSPHSAPRHALDARRPAPDAAPRRAVVALVGNPNTGKSTLFNALTGYRSHVANYPGVTVEVARGPLRGSSRPIELVDLPGTYSLAAAAPDEMIVSSLTTGGMGGRGGPDGIIAVVDASNLKRNLYLVSQLLEVGRPMLVALNMTDVARARGLTIDHDELARRLGVPVIPVVATDARTLVPLRAAIASLIDGSAPTTRTPLPEPLVREVDALRDLAAPVEALRLLLDRDGFAERQFRARGGSMQRVLEGRARLSASGVDSAAAEIRARYAWIDQLLAGVIDRPQRRVVTASERLDAILTHRVSGALVLLVVLALVFQAIFRGAAPAMDLIDGLFARLSALVASRLAPGPVQSLLCDGVIAGVGGVLVFLPQIAILFGLIAILEDCGYMARAAFMMDRVMRAAGLSGRSFIPLLSSFACAVPAIMGARVITDWRDRFVTILIAPFMSCSARLPVYVLLIGAFVPPRTYLGGWVGLAGLVMLGMYLLGVTVAIPVAWLLKRTLLAGPTPTFLLELPGYKWPRPLNVLLRMYFAVRHFVVRAGSIILLVTVVVWALAYFPNSREAQQRVRDRAAAEGWSDARLEAELRGEQLRGSLLGRMGRALEPCVRPIGWDWRIGAAVIASFPAREVVVATLGTIFNLSETDAQSASLRAALRAATWPDGRPLFTLPVALSIMVFFALCAQCASTLVMIGRETRSWRWPVLSFVGMTAIAYLAALLTSATARTLAG